MVKLKLNLASLSNKPAAPSPLNPQESHASSTTPATTTTPSLPRIKLKSAAAGSTKIRIKTQKDLGFGYDSEASDREEDPAIEEQIILRCKPGEDADYIRECLDRKEVPDMMIKFKGSSLHTRD